MDYDVISLIIELYECIVGIFHQWLWWNLIQMVIIGGGGDTLVGIVKVVKKCLEHG